ncbi:hypothetical protein F5J12DRAFT_205992 [Pisolithus orientalis]|uniref:uncharacterized protein n=1 Tax=Pisolithus orientalis TaxID=936130 RepID=UPI0022258163|nr:uncharacterized protein F5J12DRAFT_205992 [Pisolithus orientalis]KAI6002577.1 hypothetical protein F5J12DRAFT_205992 [Pisolithus orientalis]
MVCLITACISTILLRHCLRIMYGFVQHPILIHCPYVLQLVQPVELESSYISVPRLSTSRQPSLMALAEHGIDAGQGWVHYKGGFAAGSDSDCQKISDIRHPRNC